MAPASNGDEVNWTHRFFQKLFGGSKYYDQRNIWGWSVHHYAWNLARGKTNDWVAAKGDALQFDTAGYYEVLREADRVEGIVLDHWAALGEYDPTHRVKLVVDEYGPWYRPGTELDPTHMLGQQITMRDAVVTAASLDIFNRHPEKGRDGGVRATDQLPERVILCARRQVHRYAEFPRIRSVQGAPGWNGGARRVFSAIGEV